MRNHSSHSSHSSHPAPIDIPFTGQPTLIAAKPWLTVKPGPSSPAEVSVQLTSVETIAACRQPGGLTELAFGIAVWFYDDTTATKISDFGHN